MTIAVTYENEMVYQHFGHTAQFKLYNIRGDKVHSTLIVDTQGAGHGALATFLKNYQVDVLICGGIGAGAQNALTQAGIKFFGGVSGDADEAVESFLSNVLAYNPHVACSHHGAGHTCGGCGNHGCH